MSKSDGVWKVGQKMHAWMILVSEIQFT